MNVIVTCFNYGYTKDLGTDLFFHRMFNKHKFQGKTRTYDKTPEYDLLQWWINFDLCVACSPLPSFLLWSLTLLCFIGVYGEGDPKLKCSEESSDRRSLTSRSD